jgi:hypothetical protein
LYLIDAVDRQGISHPTWYPAAYFSVVEGSIPSFWHYAYTSSDGGRDFVAVWGYLELTSEGHFAGLQERDEADMLIWLRAKAMTDNLNEDREGSSHV